MSRGHRSYARITSTFLIIGAVVFSSLFIAPSTTSVSSSSPVAAIQAFSDIIASYYSDDGTPASSQGGDNSNKRAVVKAFNGVTVPTDSDLIVQVYHGSASATGLFQCMGLEIGNADAGWNFTGGTYSCELGNAWPPSTNGFISYRIENVDTYISTGRIAVNMTANDTTTLDSRAFYAYYDSIADTSGFYDYYYDGAAWANQSASRTYFVRLIFIEHEDSSIDHAYNSRLQMGSQLYGSGSWYSNPNTYSFKINQAIDGNANMTSGGFGYMVGNHTSSFVNLNFTNQLVITIGDSITAGHPYHDPTPGYYSATNDQWDGQYQYYLSNLLNQTTPNKGVGGQESGQLLTRFERDVTNYRPDYVIIMAGINDIAHSIPLNTIEANLAELYDRATSNYTTVIACTVLPDSALTAPMQAEIITLNTWISEQASSTIIVVDTNTALRDPADHNQLLALYDSGDHVHPSKAGYSKIADTVFAEAFDSTEAVSTDYYVSRITLEQVPITTWNRGTRVHTANVSYDGGYQIVVFSNSTKSSVYLTPVLTSWLKFTINSIWSAYGGISTTREGMIGEINIYGLPGDWVEGAVYSRTDWNYLTTSYNQYDSLPSPKTTEKSLVLSIPNGYVNASVTIDNRGAVSANAVSLAFNLSTTATSAISYSVYGLRSESGYRVYQDGDVIASGTGPSFSFTASDGGTFEVIVWYPKTVSSMVILTVNMVGLGILVSVIAGWVIPFTKAIKAGRYTNTNQMMKELMRGFIFIVVALIMWTMLHNIAIG